MYLEDASVSAPPPQDAAHTLLAWLYQHWKIGWVWALNLVKSFSQKQDLLVMAVAIPVTSLLRHWSTRCWQYWTSDWRSRNSLKSIRYCFFRSFSFTISKNSSSSMMICPSSFRYSPARSKTRTKGYGSELINKISQSG